jgi:hypothetical protein
LLFRPSNPDDIILQVSIREVPVHLGSLKCTALIRNSSLIKTPPFLFLVLELPIIFGRRHSDARSKSQLLLPQADIGPKTPMYAEEMRILDMRLINSYRGSLIGPNCRD